jgi:hypothetical protein
LLLPSTGKRAARSVNQSGRPDAVSGRQQERDRLSRTRGELPRPPRPGEPVARRSGVESPSSLRCPARSPPWAQREQAHEARWRSCLAPLWSVGDHLSRERWGPPGPLSSVTNCVIRMGRRVSDAGHMRDTSGRSADSSAGISTLTSASICGAGWTRTSDRRIMSLTASVLPCPSSPGQEPLLGPFVSSCSVLCHPVR